MTGDKKKRKKLSPQRKLWLREYRLKKKYNLSLGEYNEMFQAQGRQCKICGRKPNKRSLSVDHDHKTGKIRGLLCYFCNFGLMKMMREEAEIADRAAAYIRGEEMQPYDLEPWSPFRG